METYQINKSKKYYSHKKIIPGHEVKISNNQLPRTGHTISTQQREIFSYKLLVQKLK